MSSEEREKALQLNCVKLVNFRSFNTLNLPKLEKLTVFIGPNAAGKTSVVEAIQLITALKSFRASSPSDFIKWGSSQATVEGQIKGNGRQLDISLEIENNRRTYKMNGKSARLQNLKGLLPAVTFTPDDLRLVKSSNAARRSSIDDIGTQLSKNFYTVRKDYVSLVRQKNQALKDDLGDVFIDSIDEVLSVVAAQYLVHRLKIIAYLKETMSDFYRDITNGREQLDIVYQYSWDRFGTGKEQVYSYQPEARDVLEARLRDSFKTFRFLERSKKKSVIGPNGDAVGFFLQGKDASKFASQGQQRTIVLSFKLAEAALFQQLLSQKPVLLLDDVMSELDDSRRAYFLDFITGELQTFITTTHLDYFDSRILNYAQVHMIKAEESI